MANVQTKCEIRCLYCGKWFPSPIQFGDAESFFSSELIGNRVNCPFCGHMTGCNKENMRFVERRQDERITYAEGKDVI